MAPTLQHPKGARVTVPDETVDFYTSKGWTVAGAVPDTDPAPVDPPVVIPEGDPVEAWKNDQIEAFAAREGIDLGDATKKADMLAAIAAARTE